MSHDLWVPYGINLVVLPLYSPELQPAEHLWPLVDETIANRVLLTLEGLETALVARCRTLGAEGQRPTDHPHVT